ncbi:Glycosyltransferase involved in cell wall bisynthesis [Lachnospiraceae bacterium KH1T2]|nr:Glycosyltransferase involved in cell wall bisynthesis [Lachnospiraceae bacterium KH1T2]
MKQISFISVKRDECKYERLIDSIKRLRVPEGYYINFIETTAENGMAAAYEEARNVSNAEMNIYIDGNAEIIEEKLVDKLIDIYSSDDKIAIIGVTGAKYIPTSGLANESGKIYGQLKAESGSILTENPNRTFLNEVISVEGFFMAIKGNLAWRSDIFTGESFYDTAECIEYKREGYKTVVAVDDNPWIKYDRVCGAATYEEQKIFLDEYSKDIYPLVSVVIPTFQRPEYFEEALKSVINQTYRNLDIYITDNSHDDRTCKLIQKYLRADSRIKYEFYPEDEKEKNISRYYNYDNPKAEYVNYMMDDDLFKPEKIAKMIDYFLKYEDVSLVTSYRELIDNKGNRLPDASFSKPVAEETTVYDGIAAGNYLLKSSRNFIGEPTTVLVKKSILNGRYKGWSGKEGRYNISDYPLWLRAMQYGNLVYIREPLSCFRIHAGQSINNRGLLASGRISFAYEIQYAINNSKYLEKESDIRLAYMNWILSAVPILELLESKVETLAAKEKTDMKKIRDILFDMSKYISGNGTTDFEVDVVSEYY